MTLELRTTTDNVGSTMQRVVYSALMNFLLQARLYDSQYEPSLPEQGFENPASSMIDIWWDIGLLEESIQDQDRSLG